MSSMRRRSLLGSLAMTAGWPAVGRAQIAYPSKPIRIVHGYGAGSNPDTIARVISPGLMKTLGQSVIVEPKPGAGERIAAQYVAGQPPDGYTLYLITGGANVISATDPQVTFSTLKDFTYISTITLFPFALFVGEKSPVRTLKDLMAAARARPGKLNYGHAGTGNTLHLAIELLKSRTGIEMEPVAYKDQSQLITDVMNGRLDMSVSTFTNFHSALVNKQARAIAVTSKERWPLNPDVPPAADDVPDYEVVSWLGLAGPAGMEAPVAYKLSDAVQAAVALPEVQARLRDMGNEAQGSSPDAFLSRVVADYDKWKPLSKIVYP
jgi:tripartite-type tricarboxylate transporter receptor subunit TctC